MPERTITLTLSEREWERLDTYIDIRQAQTIGRPLTPEAVAVGALMREIGDNGTSDYEGFWASCRRGTDPRQDMG